MSNINEKLSKRFVGLIIGTAVGDSLGLPSEGIKRKTLAKLKWARNLKHRFIFSKGMISDDTEHTLFVTQSLIMHSDDPDKFQKALAKKLRWWLISLPAGTGMATGISIIKLWLGISPKKSGVFSAGNGPAMRSAIIGARFFDKPVDMQKYVKRSTIITHSDPKAFIGAMAISLCAAETMLKKDGEMIDRGKLFMKLVMIPEKEDKEWAQLVTKMDVSLKKNMSVKDFAAELGLDAGIGGYIYHTVPVAIYSWLRHEGDFHAALTESIRLGGDTDTVGAIVGALAGEYSGEAAIPKKWITDIVEWPRSIKVLRLAASRLAEQAAGNDVKPVRYFLPGVVIRNIIFFVIVLIHGFLRLIPASIRRSRAR